MATPLPEMNALAFPVGDGTLSLFDTKTISFTSLTLPGHFRTVKPFAHAGVLWIVASDDQATDDVLLSYRDGKWSSYPIRLPSGGYVELAGLQWGDGTSPPHLWLRNRTGEMFAVDPPEVGTRSPDAPPPLSRVGVALPPDNVARSLVPRGTLRTLDFQAADRPAERACRSRRLVSEQPEEREAASMVQLADGSTWVAVTRTHQITEEVQKEIHRPMDPIGGEARRPSSSECVWARETRATDPALELARLGGPYHPDLVMTRGGLAGAIGTDLFVTVPVPGSTYESPAFHLVTIDTQALVRR
jgi:hypothetical protein